MALEDDGAFTLNNISMYCAKNTLGSLSSVWEHDNPFKYNFQVFSIQLCLASISAGAMKALLLPYGQSSLISQILGGILIGPLCLGRIKFVHKWVYSQRTIYTIETMQYFGCMFFIFLVGVKTDLSIVKKSGKKAWVIGLFSFLSPVVLSFLVACNLRSSIKDETLASSIYYIGPLMSLSSFHDIAVILDDLKLLNSELGRLAMSTSMISGGCSMVSAFIAFTLAQINLLQTYQKDKIKPKEIKEFHNDILILSISFASFVFILLLARPLMQWIIRHTPEGKNVKEGYIFIIFVLVLTSSLVGEFAGQHYLVGPMMMGLVVPVGRPLGAAIEDKLDFFIKGLLLPLVAVSMATQLSFSTIEFKHFITVELVVLFTIIGKLIGTIVPAHLCRMPYQDGLLLGLIMNVQGVLDLQFWLRAINLQLIDNNVYSELLLSMVITTGTISPIVKVLYDPSRRYVTYKRRTIQHCKSNTEFRILACIYHDENVPTVIELLEASHPTRYSPICVYALHLLQLQGRASSLLIAHQRTQDSASNFSRSTRIINAFSFYEQDYHGIVSVNSFTAISPYTTMHDDICTLGLEKRISLIIIPFHQQSSVISTTHTNPGIRKVNQNVLNNAPCSVGILIERKLTNVAPAPTPSIIGNRMSYRVAVIFLGGADDREALAYGARMGEDTNLSLSVHRIINRNERNNSVSEKQMDYDAINEFRMNTVDNENVEYTEEEVSDVVEFSSTIKSMETSFDLLIVGRQHGEETSNLLHGLEEWSEFPELGLFGDMLVSSELNTEGSILVVQQQPCTASRSQIESPKYHYSKI